MEQNKSLSLFVIGTHDSELEIKSEVGLSFSDYNPSAEDFFEMPLETAIRLRARLLAEMSPISLNVPIDFSPSNKR